jgi:hypothetical protein
VSESPHIDDGTSAALEDDDEEGMNNKGGIGQVVLAGLIIAFGSWGLTKITDHSNDTTTATAIATLTERVSTLTEQVRKLNDQPYATRADIDGMSNRVTGLEQRFSEHERQEQSRRAR